VFQPKRYLDIMSNCTKLLTFDQLSYIKINLSIRILIRVEQGASIFFLI